jgi:hypothetical protein
MATGVQIELIMKKTFSIGALLLSSVASVFAAQTWTGKISDSMCGAKHSADEHAGKKMTDRECTLACVKDGSKYVFVTEGKVYPITNQDFADLAKHAGHTVSLTGDMSGDDITVTAISMPGK